MKIIEHIFESWGRNKQESPKNNESLKMEFLSKIPTNPVKSPYSKHMRVPWLSFAFAGIATIIFIINAGTIYIGSNSGITGSAVTPPSGSATIPSNDYSSGVTRDESMNLSSQKSISNYPSYPQQPEPPISDSREFQKLNYYATLQTRHVSDLEYRVETIVRGFDGRVDATSNTEKSGYVSFVVPKNQFEAFKTEIKSLVGSRFYIEQTNSQNLLPQKQMIEENKKQTEDDLNNLRAERTQVVRNHSQIISGYQTRINSMNTEIIALNTEYPTATPARQSEIINRIAQLQVEIGTIQSQVISENKSYQTRIGGIDTRIKYAQDSLGYVETQDQNLTDNVATVNGTINLRWISLWDMADAYLPGPLLAWIFLALALIALIWYKFFSLREYEI